MGRRLRVGRRPALDVREVRRAAGLPADDVDGEGGDFDDGLDDNLMGDEEDRLKLEAMTEKEREQVIYERLERREALKTR